MALHKYFSRSHPVYPTKVSSLSQKEIEAANASVKRCLEPESLEASRGRGKYNDYSPEERALIGKYTAENGPAKAVRRFSKPGRSLPETTARRLKSEYLLKMNEMVKRGGKNDEEVVPVVKSLPTKDQGRPLLLGQELDKSVQDYVNALRKVGGVVNTTIVVAAAEGIVAARDSGLLREHGGHIEISKAWAKSLFKRMGYVKRKSSNAGKVTVSHLNELKEAYLADIQAEVVMNEIPHELIQKQLKEVSLDEVKVDVSAAVIKAKSANWTISAWQALEKRPEIAINGFKKAGILDAVIEVTKE